MYRNLLPLFLVLVIARGVDASIIQPVWPRGEATTTYAEWDVFTSPAGPNAPNNPNPPYVAVDAAPFNPNGASNVVDTSGDSFLTGGGNIYSFSSPTHIQVTVPHQVGSVGSVTTVLFQTRTQGTEPTYEGAGGYRLIYNDGTEHTILPVRAQEQGRVALGGFGGFRVDYAAVFEVPASPALLTIKFDASVPSMSVDRIAVDTIVTPAGTGFIAQPVPEPSALGLALLASVGVVGRRRSRS